MAEQQRKEVEELVLVELTEGERVAKSIEHAAALNELDSMRERHKDAKKRLKLEADVAEERERDLRKIVETGREQRPVRCWLDFDWKAGVVLTRRIDTNAEIARRKVSDDERQVHLMDLGGALANPLPGTEDKPKRGGTRRRLEAVSNGNPTTDDDEPAAE
jgi:hypothetical protein